MQTSFKFHLIILVTFVVVLPPRASALTPFLECSQKLAAPERVYSPSEETLCKEFPQIHWERCANMRLRELKNIDNFLATGPQEVVVITDEQANAFLVNNKTIAISTALLQLLNGRDDLSFILGHELGHSRINQVRGSQLASLNNDQLLGLHPIDEFDADRYALWLNRQLGVQKIEVFENINKFNGIKKAERPAKLQLMRNREENARNFTTYGPP